MRAEVRQGPGELGRRIDHALGEVLVGASRAEFVIAALVPMPAGPVRIKAENFFPFDLDAEGGASIWLFRHRKGQRYRRRSPAWDNGRISTRPT